MAITVTGVANDAVINGGSITRSLPAGTLGGDVTIACYTVAHGSDLNLAMTTSGYTEYNDIYANGSNDANLSVFRKVQGSTPDATAVATGSGDTNDCGVLCISTQRGVNNTTPEDATTTTATGTTSGLSDPPSITTVTANALVVACGGMAGTSGVSTGTPTPPSGYTNLAFENGSDTNGSSNGHMSSKIRATAGAENPAAYSSLTGNSWAAMSVALRPATTRTGTLAVTLGDVTSAGGATGTLLIQGVLAKTLGDVTLSATGNFAISGSASITLGAVTAAGAAGLLIQGQAAITLGDVTVAATGTLPVTGQLTATLGDVTLAATGTLPITGQLGVTLGDVTLEATGVLVSAGGILGSLAVTLGDVTLEATGTLTGTAPQPEGPRGAWISDERVEREREKRWKRQRKAEEELRQTLTAQVKGEHLLKARKEIELLILEAPQVDYGLIALREEIQRMLAGEWQRARVEAALRFMALQMAEEEAAAEEEAGIVALLMAI